MDPASVYATTRGQLLTLAGGLTDGQAATPVPALPGWTVKDTYSHLTGGCGDILDGKTEDAPSPAWTARHVSRRAERSLAEVCAEWAERGPHLDEWFRTMDESKTTFIAFDVWTHQQDIRSAVGLKGERDDERVHYLAGIALRVFDRRFSEAGAPPLRIVADAGVEVLGGDEAAVTLEVCDYELLRMLFGRRSLDQITQAGWDGEPARYIEHLHIFDLPQADLTD